MTCPSWQHSSVITPARSDLTFFSGTLTASVPLFSSMGAHSASTESTLTTDPTLTFHSNSRRGAAEEDEQMSVACTPGPIDAVPPPPPTESAEGSSICMWVNVCHQSLNSVFFFCIDIRLWIWKKKSQSITFVAHLIFTSNFYYWKIRHVKRGENEIKSTSEKYPGANIQLQKKYSSRKHPGNRGKAIEPWFNSFNIQPISLRATSHVTQRGSFFLKNFLLTCVQKQISTVRRLIKATDKSPDGLQ